MKKLLIIIISGVFVFSCGKKGPPVYEEKKTSSTNIIQKYFS
jgi:hypothetical protein